MTICPECEKHKLLLKLTDFPEARLMILLDRYRHMIKAHKGKPCAGCELRFARMREYVNFDDLEHYRRAEAELLKHQDDHDTDLALQLWSGKEVIIR